MSSLNTLMTRSSVRAFQKNQLSLASRQMSRTDLRSFTTDHKEPRTTMKIVEQVRERMKGNGSWEDLWKQGLTPWDLGGPTPLLIQELKQQEITNSLRTLVPGCGSGYDIATLVAHHESLLTKFPEQSGTESVVIGLDISPTSLDRAATVVNAIEKGNTRVQLKCGDFFRDESDWTTVYTSHNGDVVSPSSEDTKFDFIFDYTFCCALPPSLRMKWGDRMSTLLRPNTGRLFTIIFPILPGEDRSKGPPYPVTVEDYRQSLKAGGVVAESEPYESPHTVPSRSGKELCCYWIKRPAARL